jgi:hypothetical protein
MLALLPSSLSKLASSSMSSRLAAPSSGTPRMWQRARTSVLRLLGYTMITNSLPPCSASYDKDVQKCAAVSDLCFQDVNVLQTEAAACPVGKIKCTASCGGLVAEGRHNNNTSTDSSQLHCNRFMRC